MPKIIPYDKKKTLETPENKDKLKEAIDKYGLKMNRRAVCEYLGGCSLPTAIKWLVGLPYTNNIRAKAYWTSDIVYRDISSQRYQENVGLY